MIVYYEVRVCSWRRGVLLGLCMGMVYVFDCMPLIYMFVVELYLVFRVMDFICKLAIWFRLCLSCMNCFVFWV